MALFKILRGQSTDLYEQELHDGYAYFTSDDGRFYIDVALTNPPLYMDMVKKSGVVNGSTIYRIEIERQAMDDAIDALATINFQHGTAHTTWSSAVNAEVVIDLQSDWNETNSNAMTFIKNKPTIINIGITVDDNAKTMFITSPIENGDGVSY